MINEFFYDYYNRGGNEEKLMSLLTPLNVNCHASDGRKVQCSYLVKKKQTFMVSQIIIVLNYSTSHGPLTIDHLVCQEQMVPCGRFNHQQGWSSIGSSATT